MENNLGIPLLNTKMMIPVIHDNLVHRPHLIDKIDTAIDYGFVVISAPPGYGKTTLVADWAHQKNRSVGWLTLDGNDNDLMVLNRYLSAILERYFNLDSQLLSETTLNRHPQTNFQSLLTLLINICSESSTDYCLVLDDYQNIHNPQIHSGIVYLLDHFPPHLLLIINSRADPPFPLARLLANHRIVELHAEDLTFSLDEAIQFLSKTKMITLSKPEIQILYEKTEGWITGLQLASLSSAKPSLIDQPGVALSSNSHLTIDYLVEEVIDLQPANVQNFLLRTSILNNLYGPLCDYVIGFENHPVNSQELLHTLYHANLFLTPLDNEEKWFRYHSLFAEALRLLLTEKHPDDVPTLYQRASEWCDQNGQYEAALFYANALLDKTRYISLLEKYAFIAVKQNQIFEILERVHNVDDSHIATSPILSLIKSWEFLLSFDIEAAEIWINLTIDLIQKKDPDSWEKSAEKEIMGFVAGERSILEIIRGNMKSAKELSKEALTLISGENDLSHSFALLNQGMTLSINGEIKKAIRVLKDSIFVGQKSGNKFVTMIARVYLGMILIDCGQLTQSKLLFEQSLDFYSSAPDKTAILELMVYKGLSEIYLVRNQLTQAEEYLKKCIEINNFWFQTISDFDTHLRLAQLYHCKNDVENCIKEVALATKLCSHSPATLDDLIIQTYEIKWSLQQGQILPAKRWIKKMGFEDRVNEFTGIPNLLADNIKLDIARLYLTQGRLEKDNEKLAHVEQVLSPLLPNLIESDLVEHQIEAYILQALAYHELNKNNEMYSALNEALIRAEPEEFRQAFLDEGIPMSRVLIHYLAALKQNKINGDPRIHSFVSDLLFRFTGKTTMDTSLGINMEPMEETSFQVDLLTAREIEVLQWVARGRSNNEIALDLHISVNTVKRHLNNAFMKLGVTNRTQAIRVAQSNGLIQ